VLLQLPYRAQFLLERQRIAEVGNLLELVDAHDYAESLFYGNAFGQGKHIGGVFVVYGFEREGYFASLVCTHCQMWNQIREEVLCIGNPLLDLVACLLYYFGGEKPVEVVFGAATEGVHPYNFHFVVVGKQFGNSVYERSLSPSARRNYHCVYAVCEIHSQAFRFLFAVGETVAVGCYSVDERIFHTCNSFVSLQRYVFIFR
jgi:hypothetical protein